MRPITPDFAEFLLNTPPNGRTGRVFKLLGYHGQLLTGESVGKIVMKIGKRAGIKVNVSEGGKVKFASAHDLRRNFGERWAHRVPAQVLRKLMRHDSITTTLKFYATVDAERIATDLAVLVAPKPKAETENSGPTATQSPDLSAK